MFWQNHPFLNSYFNQVYKRSNVKNISRYFPFNPLFSCRSPATPTRSLPGEACVDISDPEVRTMDQITIKTPNPKCRLYWGLIEFIDWRYSQSCWYFRPALWSIAALTFSLVSSPLTPFPVWISILYTRTQCVRGGGVWGQRMGVGLRQINTCAATYLYFIFKKSRHLGFVVFIYIWSTIRTMLNISAIRY